MELYSYKCKVERIVDGDTVDVIVDLGFEVFRKVRVRLARINAPDINTNAGKKAKEFLTQQLPIGLQVYLQSKSYDRYGRSIGELSYLNLNISDLMLQNGFAVKY